MTQLQLQVLHMIFNHVGSYTRRRIASAKIYGGNGGDVTIDRLEFAS